MGFPDIASSLISGGFSGLSSLLSSISANKQIKAQKEENALSRQFNHDEAAIARQFSLDMYNMNNLYNSPYNQRQLMLQAGIHPALAYEGSGAFSAAMAAQPSQASSSSSLSPVMPDFSGLRDVGSAASSVYKDIQNARESDSLRQLNEVELRYLPDKRTSEIWMNNENAIKIKNEGRLTNDQRALVAKTIAKYSEDIENVKLNNQLLELYKIGASIDNINKAIDSIYKGEMYDKTIKQIESDYNLKETQARCLVQSTIAQIQLNLAAAKNQLRQADFWDAQTYRLDYLNQFSLPYEVRQTYLNNQYLLGNIKIQDYNLKYILPATKNNIISSSNANDARAARDKNGISVDNMQAAASLISAVMPLLLAGASI